MAWVTVTEDDILTAISGAEVESYREAALQDGQADPVEPTIAQVVNEVRGYVDASGRYTLGEGATIPEKLMNATIAIVAVRIPARVGLSAGKARETAAENALELLKMVAKGNFGLEEPLIAEDEESAHGRPSFSGRTRREGRAR